MWELDNTEGWLQKNWCLQIVKPEKTLESSLDGQEIKPVNPEGNQPWIFIGKSNAKAEAPILWPLDAKNRLIGKDTDVGKGWRQKEKGAKEDEMVTWHHWFNGREFEQILGNSEGQGSLACNSPWGCKESDTTYQLNNNNKKKKTDAIKVINLKMGRLSWTICVSNTIARVLKNGDAFPCVVRERYNDAEKNAIWGLNDS